MTAYKIRRILCATDLSEANNLAVAKASLLALFLDAELVLAFVSSSTDDDTEISSMFAMSAEMKRLADDMLERDKAALDVLVEKAAARGNNVRRLLLAGDAADEISGAAIDIDADLVVTGTHGRTGIEKFLLGSVAERLIHTCRRPMMIVREAGANPEVGYRKITLPTDFSQRADRAVDIAFALAAADAEIELLHCWRLPTGVSAGPASVVRSISKSMERDIRKRGELEVKKLEGRGHEVSFHAVAKPAGQGVTERAAETGCELIVMGTHGRTGLSHFLLGSVAEITVHYASCSVVVVPSE